MRKKFLGSYMAFIRCSRGQFGPYLFFFARAHYLALSGDKFDGPEVVEGEAIFAHQPAQSATQREAGDTRTRNDPTRDCKTVQLRLAIEFGPGNSTLNPRGSAFGVNMNAFHW